MESSKLADDDGRSRSAPWYNLPEVPIVAVEHPCLISNFPRAVESLGGSENLPKLVDETSSFAEARLFLCPEDRSARPIESFNSKTSNVLLEITVPKWTGRKRKRGSGDEWQIDVSDPPSQRRLLSDPRDAQRLVHSLRDNPDRYHVQPLGMIGHTHRFRRLPDFVWSAEGSTFMTKMKEHILPFEYTKLKNFKFDWSKGAESGNDVLPPPQWSERAIPFNYSYRQNAAVQQILSTSGRPATHNTQAPRRNRIALLRYNAPEVPTQPPEGLAPESSLPANTQRLMIAIREILAERPVCTRRYLQNNIPREIWNAVGPDAAKYLWQRVAYLWLSGPWRDSLCALGVDPRKDKEMRLYQTLIFQLEAGSMDTKADKSTITRSRRDRELAARGEARESHLFDGKTASLDGKIWQMCDIEDPFLKSLIRSEALRDECHLPSDGWYSNGLIAKVRVIMKAKLELALADDADNPERDEGYLALHKLIPDVMTKENRDVARFEKGAADKWMFHLAEQIRNSATRTFDNPTTTGKTKKKRPPMWARTLIRKAATPGQRGRGGRKKGGNGRPKDNADTGDGQEMLDPQLRDNNAGRQGQKKRDAAMKAFEDEAAGSESDADVDASELEDDDDESSETGESEDDSDVDESGFSQGRSSFAGEGVPSP
ncbi:MAG: hypothetical protein Q9228_003256 [Teloschistes exilis]